MGSQAASSSWEGQPNLGVPQPILPRPRFQAPVGIALGVNLGVSSLVTPPRLPQPDNTQGRDLEMRAPLTPVWPPNRGMRPMRPVDPPGHIPVAPTRHYGRTTPFDDRGQPATPLIPTAPPTSGMPATPIGDMTTEEAIADILHGGGGTSTTTSTSTVNLTCTSPSTSSVASQNESASQVGSTSVGAMFGIPWYGGCSTLTSTSASSSTLTSTLPLTSWTLTSTLPPTSWTLTTSSSPTALLQDNVPWMLHMEVEGGGDTLTSSLHIGVSWSFTSSSTTTTTTSDAGGPTPVVDHPPQEPLAETWDEQLWWDQPQQLTQDQHIFAQQVADLVVTQVAALLQTAGVLPVPGSHRRLPPWRLAGPYTGPPRANGG